MTSAIFLAAPGAPAGSLLLVLQEAADSTGGGLLDALPVADAPRSILMAVIIGVVGIPAVFVLSKLTGRWLADRYTAQMGMVAERIFLYVGLALVTVTFLNQLGVGLAPLLGAAGIVGIALGFASQTSVSNIISGFFLMAEQPFRVDDVIRVGQTTGKVISIDTLSVKLRTFRNEFVRIPNESLIKSELTNITRFPIRRLDIPVGVAYREDVERARDVLLEIADMNPLSLMEPAPTVRLEQFGTSSIDLTLAIWTVNQNFLELKTSIQEEIKARFDEEGIEIPFPHQTLYSGSRSEPFPIRLVTEHPRGAGAEEGPGGDDSGRPPE